MSQSCVKYLYKWLIDIYYLFQSYISCSIGIWNVGFVMICYGVVDATCSFTFGRLVQYVGHIPFFILGKFQYDYAVDIYCKTFHFCMVPYSEEVNLQTVP